jgi:hypothetical protein
MSLIGDAIGLLAKAPPGLVDAVVRLIKSVGDSNDPARAAARHAAAIASEQASEAAIRRAMKVRR